MRFYLGTHEPSFLSQTDVPLFVSRIRLERRVTLPRARGPWAMDSGGFSELDKAGRWSIKARDYAAYVRRCADEIGGLEWAAIMDWMCEDRVRAMTGYTVAQHQQLTVNNWLTLNSIDGSLPWVPVLQGMTEADYHRCADLYERHTCTRLATLPRVGLGSVCRRQADEEIERIVTSLHARGLTNLHGFGVKMKGLDRYAHLLASADSLAWSFHASKRPPMLPGCTHKTCGNCLKYALHWRGRVLARVARPAPGRLF